MQKSQITRGVGSSQGQMGKMDQEKYSDSWSDDVSDNGMNYEPGSSKIRKVGKSFADHAMSYPDIVEGIEEAPEFLLEIVKGISNAFDTFEVDIDQMLEAYEDNVSEIEKSIGELVLGFEGSVSGVLSRANDVAHEASMVKSLAGGGIFPSQGVNVIRKSAGDHDVVSHEEVYEAMMKSVEAGDLSAHDVINFEVNSVLSPRAARVLGVEVQHG